MATESELREQITAVKAAWMTDGWMGERFGRELMALFAMAEQEDDD